jgi:UDP-N-acetylglucosamine 2-epimerase (non-hydrolysing)
MDALADAPLPVVLPAHPRTVNALERDDRYGATAAAIDLIDPVGYLDFVRLLVGARRVATDSGGVQKEAFYLDTPCVTLREETEWIELVECGWNRLVGADPEQIRAALREPFDRSDKPTPYGDGTAARQIARILD